MHTHWSAVCGWRLVAVRQCDEVCGGRRERKALPGQWCVTGDIRELVQGQPLLTVTTPPDIHPRPWELWSAHMGQWRLEIHGFITQRVCDHQLAFVCVSSFIFVFACAHAIWFLQEQHGLPRWSRVMRRRVDAFRQWAGNLNLHTPCLQLLGLLPQEPGLLLHALCFVPHPAKH